MQKNKLQTKDKILEAFSDIIKNEGFKGLGINSIAKRAGVAKVLIYRYFENTDGMLKAYLESGKLGSVFKPERLEELSNLQPKERGYIWAKRLIGVAQELRNNKLMKALLLYELTDDNKTLALYTQYRNQQLAAMVKKLELNTGTDTEAITTVMSSSVIYLALAEEKRRHYINMDLQDEESWNRINQAIEFIYEAINEKIIKETRS